MVNAVQTFFNRLFAIERPDFRLENYYAHALYQHLTDRGYAIWSGYFVDTHYLESKTR